MSYEGRKLARLGKGLNEKEGNIVQGHEMQTWWKKKRWIQRTLIQNSELETTHDIIIIQIQFGNKLPFKIGCF